MVASTAKVPAANSTLVADDISQYAYKSWNELFSMPRKDVEAFQLRSARRRFEELAPQVAVLKDQADQRGVTRIETLNDVVPLLFDHTVYKSYPMSLLENKRFDLLTRWLQRLTSIDLSGVDASQCTGLDNWMDTLERETPLQVFHTSGTSGKFSFFPRTTLERDLLDHTYLAAFGGGFGDEPSTLLGGPNGTRMPVVYPSVRNGRFTTQRVVRNLAENVAPTPDQCYTLTNGTLSADVVALSGRIRLAQAKGEVSKMKLTESERMALKQYIEEQERRPQEMAEFFGNLVNKLQGKRIFLFSQDSYLYQAAASGLERNISSVFSPDSIICSGGGSKGLNLPDNYRDQIRKFTGITTWRYPFGMTEIIAITYACSHQRFHLQPHIVPFLLDPGTGAALPRSGTQTGRFAALDLLAQNCWGGIITADKMTMEWDSTCPCGRKGVFIHEQIERYATHVTGDDKITCSATVDNTDAALHKLLAG